MNPLLHSIAWLLVSCGEAAIPQVQASPAQAEAPKPELDKLGLPRAAGVKPVERLREWTKMVLAAAEKLQGDVPSKTPEDLLAHMTKAEREADFVSFAAGLQVADTPECLLWAAGLLVPQTAIRAHDAALLLLRKNHPDNPVTVMAATDRQNRFFPLNKAYVGKMGNAYGFFHSSGTLLLRVIETPRGWRVAPLGEDELLNQPPRVIASFIPDLALWQNMSELLAKDPGADPTLLLETTKEVVQSASRRVQRELQKSQPKACVDCGDRATRGNKCEMCALFD